MSKVLSTLRTKLLWKLLGCILFSGTIAIAIGIVIARLGNYYVENTFDSQEMNRGFQQKYMEDLQEYVNSNQIAPSNISLLENWADENNLVYFSVYFNNKMIFNSDYSYADEEELEEVDETYDISTLNSDYFYRLNMWDGTVTSVDMFCYDFYNYSNYVLALSVVVGIILFIIIFTRLVNRKLNYIKKLENELSILEGGDLDYAITIKGNDELSSLARGIDQMRLSVIENNLKEQKALQANKNLVTAMSHDLRTPLTTLTGYLEILNMGQNLDEEKKKHYIQLSAEKTKEIRELSDELFEYFLVYGEQQRRIDVEPVPASELVADLIENQFLTLEEEGYIIKGNNKITGDAGNCLINPQYMRRVLNNILSNLGKYADKNSPIEVTGQIDNGKLSIRVKNVIGNNLEPHESTKIGLITCERIMKLHNGEFKAYEEKGSFIDELVIPMENNKAR